MSGDIDMSDSDISDEEEMGLIGGQPIHTYVSDLFTNIVTALKAANDLPQGDDYDFYKSFRSFPKIMSEYSALLMSLVEKVSEIHTPGGLPPGADGTDELTDFIETLFESIDSDIDAVRAQASAKKLSAEEKIRRRQLLKAVQGVRPQDTFADKIDNTTAPWVPFIVAADGSRQLFPQHPYGAQIKGFQLKPWQLQAPAPSSFAAPEDVKCTYIDKPGQLEKLAHHLLEQREFAVDLEHHSMHSFQGFVCLMQVSTRQQDYIVDCLALRSHMHKLLSSFANENIMKVLHGASSDIEWLQRDFGLYIVNMFDTGAAAQQLNIPHGLGKVLGHFGITVDKKYQTADWRQRPLSTDMLKYARLDTHYLLPTADKLRQLLMQQGPRGGVQHPLKHVYDESNALCLRQYKKPSVDDDEMRLMGRIDAGVRQRHGVALRAILEWRDKVARDEDESYQAVLPNATCISLAQELPNISLTKSAICKLFTPTPRLLQQHVASLVSWLEGVNYKTAPPADAQAPQAAAAKHDKSRNVDDEAMRDFGWTQAQDDDDMWELQGNVTVLPESGGNLYAALTQFIEADPKMKELLKHFEQVKQETEGKAAVPVAAAAAPQQVGSVPTQPAGLVHSLQGAPPPQTLVPGDVQDVVARFTKPEDFTSLAERTRKEQKEKKKKSLSGGAEAGDAKRSKKAKDKKLPHEKPSAATPSADPAEFLKNIGWEQCEMDMAAPTPASAAPPKAEAAAQGQGQAMAALPVYPPQAHQHAHQPVQQQTYHMHMPPQQQQQQQPQPTHRHFNQSQVVHQFQQQQQQQPQFQAPAQAGGQFVPQVPQVHPTYLPSQGMAVPQQQQQQQAQPQPQPQPAHSGTPHHVPQQFYPQQQQQQQQPAAQQQGQQQGFYQQGAQPGQMYHTMRPDNSFQQQ